MPASGRMRLSRRASFVYQGQRQLHLVPSPELAFELHDFRRARSPARQNQNLAWLDTHNFIHGGRGKRRLDVTYLIRVWGDMDLNRLGGTKAAGDRDQREHGGPANESHRSTRYFWGGLGRGQLPHQSSHRADRPLLAGPGHCFHFAASGGLERIASCKLAALTIFKPSCGVLSHLEPTAILACSEGAISVRVASH